MVCSNLKSIDYIFNNFYHISKNDPIGFNNKCKWYFAHGEARVSVCRFLCLCGTAAPPTDLGLTVQIVIASTPYAIKHFPQVHTNITNHLTASFIIYHTTFYYFNVTNVGKMQNRCIDERLFTIIQWNSFHQGDVQTQPNIQ